MTNPPYGARCRAAGGQTGGTGDRAGRADRAADLRDLYAALGQLIGGGPPPRGAPPLLVADPVLAGHTGLRLEERLRTTNGGIPVRLLVSGSSRRTRRRAVQLGQHGAPVLVEERTPARAAGRRRPPAGRTG